MAIGRSSGRVISMIRQGIRSMGARLKGSSGLSFLVALLFMIVSATVVAIVLSSAAVNAERAKQHQVEEQGYFAVQSALQLVNDSAKKETGGLLNGDYSKRLTMTGSAGSLQPSREPSSHDLDLSEWASEQAKRVGQAQSPVPKKVTVPKVAYNGVELPEVELTYKMKGEGSFDIQIEAQVKSETLPDGTKAPTDYANTLYLNYKSTVGDHGVEWAEGVS